MCREETADCHKGPAGAPHPAHRVRPQSSPQVSPHRPAYTKSNLRSRLAAHSLNKHYIVNIVYEKTLQNIYLTSIRKNKLKLPWIRIRYHRKRIRIKIKRIRNACSKRCYVKCLYLCSSHYKITRNRELFGRRLRYWAGKA